ncbi:hypothetical protein [Mesorhizobium sp. STM 4661]|uniref:hypothetical protein n=1 Tax=Mesorhizobium sp. STM 4661 TaxID=1297570 RepID=UPI0002BDBDEE|nr:hypothetical protein [Mesorhizobium sp. STM 4661]CCV12910.1 hypothetical protein MESS4_510077 [Mesorhizobium sp. STM 4661]
MQTDLSSERFPIAGYEGLYAISRTGQVWSFISNKFLKSGLVGKGYSGEWKSYNGWTLPVAGLYGKGAQA